MQQILIIDDEPLMAEMLCDLVKRMGYEGKSVSTLTAADREIETGEFDVVFLDVHMPDGNGLDFLGRIKNTPSSPEVIIITGYGDADGAELAIKSGAWDYIEKASSISKLKLPLLRALEYREAKKSTSKPFILNREGIVGKGPRMNACLELLAQAATSDANVLITGETGTGKELFARAIHSNSSRRDREMVTIDCAALPSTLVESVLFGHEKGSFTGADARKDGLIRQADGGTLFLDEVGEMPLTIQKEFLRVLQEHRFRPVGGKSELNSDFRLVAATNRDLAAMVEAGQFREDLLYRIRALVIELPPLREHKEDIPDLVLSHMRKISNRNGMPLRGISTDFLEALGSYDWPGNVRELLHTVDSAMAVSSSEQVLFSTHLSPHIRIELARRSLKPKTNARKDPLPLQTMRERRQTLLDSFERDYLRELMSCANGDIRKACEISGLSRPRLYSLLQKYPEVKGHVP
ncbi:MAG: sigma-54-dependent Fis family transcriptional regulator [Syntrophaceae bacterium]|nr:sigma-54-dependent Fis family transcriptional regulator [Syntrophaceae bacterium]